MGKKQWPNVEKALNLPKGFLTNYCPGAEKKYKAWKDALEGVNPASCVSEVHNCMLDKEPTIRTCKTLCTKCYTKENFAKFDKAYNMPKDHFSAVCAWLKK